jgi:membrane-bound lytic murein transglycosylase B
MATKRIYRKFCILCLLLTGFSVVNANESTANNFTAKSEVQEFISYMNHKHNLDKQDLQRLFTQFSSNQDVLHKISNPSEKLSWEKYRKLLLSPNRVTQGRNFLNNYKEILNTVELQFKVPKELIVAILGVESFYGKSSGNLPVFQSLATLAFDYPPRGKFFKQELENFLLLVKEEKLDPYTMQGSYAGAMSPAQFIPSSYRNYAIDFAKIGTKNLNNMQNAIGSIANYFVKHGWKGGQNVACVAKINNLESTKFRQYLEPSGSKPMVKYSLRQLQQVGVESLASQNRSHNLDRQVSLMEFINENKRNEYWLGFENFCVITKYNHSVNYALAVYQLAVELGLVD